jgi:hypothetical protein
LGSPARASWMWRTAGVSGSICSGDGWVLSVKLFIPPTITVYDISVTDIIQENRSPVKYQFKEKMAAFTENVTHDPLIHLGVVNVMV